MMDGIGVVTATLVSSNNVYWRLVGASSRRMLLAYDTRVKISDCSIQFPESKE